MQNWRMMLSQTIENEMGSKKNNMSMISEFVNHLREKAKVFHDSDLALSGVAKDYKECADLIEELSEKLANDNMSRSEQYYNDVNKKTDFEKILREKLSENTYKIITSSDKGFSDWLDWLKFHAEKCGELYYDQWTENIIKSKCHKIADHHGYGEQSRMLQEECGELVRAVNKHHRNGNMDNLIEELADVQIMMIQILYLLRLDEETYRKKIMSKLDRELERMEKRKA